MPKKKTPKSRFGRRIFAAKDRYYRSILGGYRGVKRFGLIGFEDFRGKTMKGTASYF